MEGFKKYSPFNLMLDKPFLCNTSRKLYCIRRVINSNNIRETKFCQVQPGKHHFQLQYQALKHSVGSCVSASTLLVESCSPLQTRFLLYLHILGKFSVLCYRYLIASQCSGVPSTDPAKPHPPGLPPWEHTLVPCGPIFFICSRLSCVLVFLFLGLIILFCDFFSSLEVIYMLLFFFL